MRVLPVLGIGLAVGLVIAGCGSGAGSSGSAAPSSAGAGGAKPTITVGLSAVTTVSAELYLGRTQGFFAKHGVTVNLTNTGSTSATEAAAGRVDLVQVGCSSALAPAVAGHQTSIVFWMLANNAGIQVPAGSALRPANTAAGSVMELAGKRIAVQGVGTGAYGEAQAMRAYIGAHGAKPPVVVSLPNASAISAQLVSGQVDAAVGAADVVAGAVADGKVRILVRAENPGLKEVSGGDVAGVCLWGLKSKLAQEPKAVAAFIAGMRDAYRYVTATQPATIAGILHTTKDFGSLGVDTVEQSLGYDVPLFTTSAGQLTPAVWETTLKAFAGWGLGLNLSDPRLSYGDIVDMSYWNASTALLGGS
ncbi:MAG TPA: ABC transporter substrate-binding protein [Pseudonocardiaceae bacterium]